MVTKLSDTQKNQYLEALKKYKDDGLYRRTIGQGLVAMPANPNVDIMVMDLSDAFFAMFRRTGEEDFFIIGKVLRRAAHVLHREALKQHKHRKPNYDRFLNIIR